MLLASIQSQLTDDEAEFWSLAREFCSVSSKVLLWWWGVGGLDKKLFPSWSSDVRFFWSFILEMLLLPRLGEMKQWQGWGELIRNSADFPSSLLPIPGCQHGLQRKGKKKLALSAVQLFCWGVGSAPDYQLNPQSMMFSWHTPDWLTVYLWALNKIQVRKLLEIQGRLPGWHALDHINKQGVYQGLAQIQKVVQEINKLRVHTRGGESVNMVRKSRGHSQGSFTKPQTKS